MFKKLGLTILILNLMVGMSFAGGVTDNNNGNLGDILVHSGINNGANSVGTWTDASFLKGQDGVDGKDGERGEQGVAGQNGIDGKDGVAGQDGVDGNDGKDGEKGEKGERGLQGRGLENRHELMVEGRIFDTRKTTFSVYSGYDTNNKVAVFGAKLTIKFGTSYEEREIAKIKKQLEALQNR